MALEDTPKAMEIDGRIVTIPRRKPDDDILVQTPPLGAKRPAKMRLGTSEQQRKQASEEEFPLTERKRALFEPLGPPTGKHSASSPDRLPPPDFENASYPRGWVVGKKRKLVNVDVVESMRRIAVQEMNRKDREITSLSDQLEEDSQTMELLQLQLQQERSKRAHVERENTMLEGQIRMLMAMIPEAQEPEDGETFET